MKGSAGFQTIGTTPGPTTGEDGVMTEAPEVMVPMAGVIDVDLELSRIEKECQKFVAEAARLDEKLSNDQFVARAPAEVVEKEREKLAAAREAIAALNVQRERIEELR